jgi:hypothetical protein
MGMRRQCGLSMPRLGCVGTVFIANDRSTGRLKTRSKSLGPGAHLVKLTRLPLEEALSNLTNVAFAPDHLLNRPASVHLPRLSGMLHN